MSANTIEWPKWPIFGEIEEKFIKESLTSNDVLNQSFIKEFNGAFARYNKIAHCIAVANGTVSLEIALEALGIGYGDEVIVPGLTWAATAAAVINVNAIPILVDIERDTYCIDPEKIESAISENTKAIIPVHLYCGMANMSKVKKIAIKNDLFIIEDASHVHGAEWNGMKAGTIGDIGCFSMQKSKVMTSGEGGAVITDNDRIYALLDALHNNGRINNIEIKNSLIHGNNYRISDVQAAILLAQLGSLDEYHAIREKNAKILNEGLSKIDGIKMIKKYEQVNRAEYYFYVFRYEEEAFDGLPVCILKKYLEVEIGLEIGKIYRPLNNNPLYAPLTKKRHHLEGEYRRKIDPKKFLLPIAESTSKEAILLHHSVLLGGSSKMEAIIRCIEHFREQC